MNTVYTSCGSERNFKVEQSLDHEGYVEENNSPQI